VKLSILLTIGVLATSCAARVPAVEISKVYGCPLVDAAPVIDGKLDDAAWRIAPPLTLVSTFSGLPVPRTTVARMCWDRANLYVAFECAGPEIWGTVTERDGPIYLQDAAEIFLEPKCYSKDYFELDISPKNVVFDGRFDRGAGMPLGSQAATDWSCEGWKTATGIIDRPHANKEWTAEMAIPFASLGRMAPQFGERWRANLYRVSSRPRPWEYQAWSPTYTRGQAFHIPSRFGMIVFSEYKHAARTQASARLH
jgi:hypothetical protein